MIFNNTNKNHADKLKPLFDQCTKNHLNANWAIGKLYIPGNSEEQFENLLTENLTLAYDSACLLEYDTWGGTIEYYNQNALKYCEKTVGAKMQETYDMVEPLLHKGDKLLDLGCGSGRDSKYFISKGYDVVSVDGSIEICRLAENYIGKSVLNVRFEELNFDNEFNAIWACASLIHTNSKEILSVMNKLNKALKSEGIIYASWKYGTDDSIIEGRQCLKLDEMSLAELFNSVPFKILNIWVTEDSLSREEKWINIIGQKYDLME